MPRSSGRTARSSSAEPSISSQRDATLKWLERRGSQRNREGMARYAIRAEKVFGVSVGALRQYAKRLGRSHELAAALWTTGWYEARMLACLIDDPARVTIAQMNRWARDFDNWAICDTASFALFDRTTHAWGRVDRWAASREEFVKRAAFALLASLTVHDRTAPDTAFARRLALIERAATDDRNFVSKAVNWALRSIGKRSVPLNLKAVVLAKRLARSPQATARWAGKDALRELTSDAVVRRLRARAARD